MADCQAVVEIKNDLIRTMGECRDVTDQYQTGRSAYLRLGQLFMRLFAGLPCKIFFVQQTVRYSKNGLSKTVNF